MDGMAYRDGDWRYRWGQVRLDWLEFYPRGDWIFFCMRRIGCDALEIEIETEIGAGW